MGKLPKELQEKIRRARSLRSQGNPSINPDVNKGGNKGINRQMRRRMKNQGIEGMEPIEAKKVIIQTDTGNLVIENPQVVKMQQQGMEIYQVIGSANTVDGNDELIENMEDQDTSLISDNQENVEINSPNNTSLQVEITDQDIELVAMQTGVSKSEAEKALHENGGDLARAILYIKSKPN